MTRTGSVSCHGLSMATSGAISSTGASRSTTPSSASCTSAMATNVLLIEPTRKWVSAGDRRLRVTVRVARARPPIRRRPTGRARCPRRARQCRAETCVAAALNSSTVCGVGSSPRLALLCVRSDRPERAAIAHQDCAPQRTRDRTVHPCPAPHPSHPSHLSHPSSTVSECILISCRHRRTRSRIELDTERKLRTRNKLYYRFNHWPIWIFVFFIAPGPLTADLFAAGFDARMAIWLGLVLVGTGIAGLAGKLPGCEPAPYIIRFTEDRPNPCTAVFATRRAGARSSRLH